MKSKVILYLLVIKTLFITTVNVNAQASFLGADTTLCAGQTLELVAGIDTDTTNYIWSDGSVGSGLLVSQSGVYSVIVSTDSLTIIQLDTIEVNFNPVPEAVFEGANSCLGSEAFFTNNSIAEVGATYYWDFGDSNFSNSDESIVGHSYSGDPQDYNIRLIIDNNNGCMDSSSIMISTLLTPDPSMTYQNLCSNTPFTLVNTSENLQNPTYIIDYGESQTDPFNDFIEIEYNYNASGVYSGYIYVENDNGCNALSALEFDVKETPIIELASNTVCGGMATSFTTNATYLDGANFYWDFGDGNNSIVVGDNVDYNYNDNGGEYFASLTIDNNNGCSALDSVLVETIPVPTAIFETDSVCIGSAITIENLSQNLNPNFQGSITFGDGNLVTLTNENVSQNYVYQSAGIYQISALVENEGCKDSTTIFTEVFPLPEVSFSGLDAEYCVGGGQDVLEGNPIGGLFSGLNIEDTNAEDNIGFLIPTEPSNNSNVYYTYTDQNGCENQDSQIVSIVYPQPSVEYFGLDSLYCQGDQIDTLFGNVEGGVFTGVNVVQDIVDNADVAYFDPVESGIVDIFYEFTDVNGCQNSSVQTVEIFELPTASLPADTSFVSGENINLSVESQEGVVYLWSNGSTSNSISLSNPGYYILTASNESSGCMIMDTVLVSILSSTLAPNSRTEISVSPNPTDELINIRFIEYSDIELPMTVELISSNGELISRDVCDEIQDLKIIVGDLPIGYYFLQIGQNTFKILKQ